MSDKYQYRALTAEQKALAGEIMYLLDKFAKDTNKPVDWTNYRWFDRLVYEDRMWSFGQND